MCGLLDLVAGLVCLVWFGRFGLVGLVWLVCLEKLGRFGLIGLVGLAL